MFVHKKCTICNDIIYESLDGRNDTYDLFENENYEKHCFIAKPFMCPDCRSDVGVEKRKNQQIENDKIIKELKSMPYKDYLETDHWKQLRKRKLRLSGYKCQICASKDDLNVHHNTYENRGCEKDEDLVVLCNECHKKHHGIDNGINHNINIKPNDVTSIYKIKLFECNLNTCDITEEYINKFIADNVIELIDIKTNLSDYTYTMLIIYK